MAMRCEMMPERRVPPSPSHFRQTQLPRFLCAWGGSIARSVMRMHLLRETPVPGAKLLRTHKYVLFPLAE